jgi:hypothetical protein
MTKSKMMNGKSMRGKLHSNLGYTQAYSQNDTTFCSLIADTDLSLKELDVIRDTKMQTLTVYS